MPRWHNSKRLLQQTPYASAYWLAACRRRDLFLFGHTAIRYENYTRGIDAVAQYGMFNSSAPNFIFRFALGETDYQHGVTDYEHFAAEYNYLGRDVWQQTLNLTRGKNADSTIDRELPPWKPSIPLQFFLRQLCHPPAEPDRACHQRHSAIRWQYDC